MNVLVTGASGMLGRGVATALMQRGDAVTVLQRRPSGFPLDEVLGDVHDPRVVTRAVRGHDAVVHLAARVSTTGAWSEFERVNVHGTRSLLDAARAADVRRFVHVSSPSVAHVGQPLVGSACTPASPAHARGNYARSKAQAERIALAASSAEMPVVAVRPHLVWGPGDEQLVARIVRRARAGRLVLVNNGTALIDSTYVDNAVQALVAALDHAPDVAGRAFVVSNGEPRTVAELVARICVAFGVAPPTRSVSLPVASAVGWVIEGLWAVGRRAAEPPLTRFLAEQLGTAHWFDQRETRRLLKWSPSVSLDEGFARLADSRRQ